MLGPPESTRRAHGGDAAMGAGKPPLIAGEPGEVTRELQRRTLQLEQSERRFRDVIERNADAIVVVDEIGVVRFANTAAAELFGRLREELIGRAFGFPLVAGETTELDLVSRGGPRVAEMRVVESEWEEQPAFIATLRDVTERHNAEQTARRLIREQADRAAAERAARKFRFLAESSTVLSSSLDTGATLSALARLCASEVAEWVTGYLFDAMGVLQHVEVAHRDAAQAEPLREPGKPPRRGSRVHAVVQRLREGGPLLLTETKAEDLGWLTEDEHGRKSLDALGAVSLMLVPLTARGHLLGAIALVCPASRHQFDVQDLALAEDVASRAALAIDNARLYEEARTANQTKSDLLAAISHDLRTPLSAIIGYADLLEEGIPETLSERGAPLVRRMRISAKHLTYLIDELLAFAKLDARREIQIRDIDLRDLGTETAAIVEPLAREKGLQLTVELPERPVPMR